ncbi:Ankyrin repeat protein (plasmid) [Rickettsiales bacterium Ac37b]|nr:Ankyrin repeat protein [Rickettsiales bacterium Ac37b]
MKEVDTRVNPELIKKVFSAVMESTNSEKLDKLVGLLDKNNNFVEALNGICNDDNISLNILHNLAVSEHCRHIFPRLIQYLDTFLYKQQSHEGKTPIMSAISAGRLDNAEVLVEAQRSALKKKGMSKSQIDKEIADTVNIQDNKGQTPLHIAAHAHKPEYITFLLSKGADRDVRDHEGDNPVIKAAKEIDDNTVMIRTIASLLRNSGELYTYVQNDKTLLKIIEDTLNITWGTFQEKELKKACDRNKGKGCSII